MRMPATKRRGKTMIARIKSMEEDDAEGDLDLALQHTRIKKN